MANTIWFIVIVCRLLVHIDLSDEFFIFLFPRPLTPLSVFRPDLVDRQVSGISTTSASRRFGRPMPTPQSGRESVLHMAVDGFKTLVVRDFIVTVSTC